MRSTSSPMPTGTVELVTTTLSRTATARCLPRPHRHSTNRRGHRRECVPTTINTASASPTGLERSVMNFSAWPWRGRHELVDPRLVDSNLARMKSRDFILVLVDADDVATEIHKAGLRHQSHIARAGYSNLRKTLPLKTDVSLNSLDFPSIRPHAQDWARLIREPNKPWTPGVTGVADNTSGQHHESLNMHLLHSTNATGTPRMRASCHREAMSWHASPVLRGG